MDNLCHTLVGAAFGEAGLRRRTRFASTTLMIASNLPDIDVLVFATSVSPVAFRRGWTHGILAQLLLPIILAGLVSLLGRRRRNVVSVDSRSSAVRDVSQETAFVPLLQLSYLGVLLHVGMDWLNNYGVRLLKPFSDRWFYGDTLFIIDPWLWGALGLGTLLARRRGRMRYARVALLASGVYVAAMLGGAMAARAFVADAWTAAHGRPPQRFMVGPLPITPFRRLVIVDTGEAYATGEFDWFPARVQFDRATVPKNADAPQVLTARAHPVIEAFLIWSRFPFWTLSPVAEGTEVTVGDMRFSGRGLPPWARGRFGASVIVGRR